jgi:hypothetical protein
MHRSGWRLAWHWATNLTGTTMTGATGGPTGQIQGATPPIQGPATHGATGSIHLATAMSKPGRVLSFRRTSESLMDLPHAQAYPPNASPLPGLRSQNQQEDRSRKTRPTSGLNSRLTLHHPLVQWPEPEWCQLIWTHRTPPRSQMNQKPLGPVTRHGAGLRNSSLKRSRLTRPWL